MHIKQGDDPENGRQASDRCRGCNRSELLELGELEARYAEATKTLAELEKPLKAARLALVEKVLGVPFVTT